MAHGDHSTHDDKGLGDNPPGPTGRERSIFGALAVGLSIVGTLLIVIMTVAVNADILGRDLFNHPVAGVTEFIGLSIVAVVFLQMANTAREARHINNDLILAMVARVSRVAARRIEALFELLATVLFSLIVWFVWPIFVDNYYGGYFKGTVGYIEIPLWPFTGIVVIGAAAAAIQHLLLMWRILRSGTEHDHA